MRVRHSLVLLTAAAALAASANPGHTKPRRDDTRSVGIAREESATPGQRLDLDLETGASVRITGWDRDVVSISTTLENGKCPGADVRIERKEYGISVVSDYERDDARVRSCSMFLEIKVPSRFDVRIRSSGGGLAVAHVQGRFTGHTGGGGFSFRDVKGNASLSTGGGPIEVSDCTLDGSLNTGGGPVTFEHVTGSVVGTTGSNSRVVRGESARDAE